MKDEARTRRIPPMLTKLPHSRLWCRMLDAPVIQPRWNCPETMANILENISTLLHSYESLERLITSEILPSEAIERLINRLWAWAELIEDLQE